LLGFLANGVVKIVMKTVGIFVALLSGLALVVAQDDDAPPPKQLSKKTTAATAAATKTGGAPDVGIDELLGRGGRKAHAERLARTKVDGKVYSWDDYERWGKELYFNCQVAKPPIGPAPSKLISEFYKCTHCHNHLREDRVLSKQDPEDRFAMIVEQPEKKITEGSLDAPLRLQPGTTMWGAVNRESFYNDSYMIYHRLAVGGGRPMNPQSLEDATQVCCTYCSVGRLAEEWEILAMLTYFWSLEVKLADLDLPTGAAAAIAAVMQASGGERDPLQVANARKTLRQLYLTRAGDEFTAVPKDLKSDTQGPYPDKAQFQGDAAIGKKLYAVACDHCHGEGKPNESAGADLVRNLAKYHAVLAYGTQQDKEPYMPMFSRQRLSRQQIADVQAYLKSL
jgi:mono/diheme cytochrome c family protein